MSAPVGQGIEGRPTHVTPERFFGQGVVVTGAAQGIGMAVAHRIAYEDGNLVLVDRSPLVHEVAEELRKAGAGTVDSFIADLETFEGATDALEFAGQKLKNLDVVINNVGGTIWAKPYQEYSEEEIRKEINRSLFPTLWMCRAALPILIGNGGGTIVNVSSIATGGINRVPYAAAKGGVNGIVSAMAREAAPHNVRVVATAPGGTLAPERAVKRGPGPEGELEEKWYQQIVDQTIDSSLMKRYGTLEEQAAPICFLASEEASYITGSVMPVGGGDQG
ncbi:1,6-dihydroxycyclohexa-2,4-diene-1-carboxylate dehydrogenase [Corynebacterium glutamicum MT]|uniref:1,6-dihydroxycyclohexa-2,4-diene-1-carboxylate dehydrogenase n=1 Tax=Corynebacterium glutamicum TaxID=1718 RepID=A0AB36IBI8_CORGT|nr:1,6-dihydroxycyclohexa-2,4-diene-1-carboxylate dehydrogenase [Corynebacterium glutamicum]AGN19908.1 1,6-dihydroxycyclohexa-2,4-diene-1-carboxylate dehydrogenase [Corynebacterium glutamicum SCgG1]AGN22933.1 1,6-dihydroxycyclohexa-2,4-diene-1-carboxylate dehydrogenase [Corynebacterium glutamicum SCgG2]EGV40265.1 1,6-dihydroxycyclohexa-2,4-diene-1-carboxylate dehydrogenase [Corynebacterium glutamicum S9114]EOA63420.1 1,6-dihydroxycyclohexa-2,4-diene-1-carboxylate dehydrogenase [Corynebacterium 